MKKVILLLVLISTLKAQAQIYVFDNLPELKKIKNGTTYVIMKDISDEKSQPFIEIFKTYWTVSKVSFINYSDLENNLSPENSYVSFTAISTTKQSTRIGADSYDKGGLQNTETTIYLDLWTVVDRYFKQKGKKKFDDSYKYQQAYIALFTDTKTMLDYEKINELDFDGNGHIKNWGPGILKNQLQKLMDNFKKLDKQQWDLANPIQLKKLNNEVLYIPDYVLIKFNRFNGDESEKHDEKKLLEDYDLKYQIVSMDFLNEKILTETKPFYYFIYIKNGVTKHLNVINSLTGEVIYSEVVDISYNLSEKDFKKIAKKIKSCM